MHRRVTINMDSKDSPWPERGGSHQLPPYNIFCAWPPDQHPNIILFQDSQVGVPKFAKLGLPQLWRHITLCANLWLRWGLKQSYSLHQELSNGMWHTIYTQGNQSDSRLLVVNLAFGLSFGHNLCFKYPNGSCKPILDIYAPRDFQWYNKHFNPISFDPYNHSLKIWESI